MPFGANLTGEEGEAERGDGVRITSNAFSVLGVRAALGRTLTAEDDDPKKEPAAVLTYGHFLRRFGGDPKVLGRAIVLNGQSHMVKGVLPRDFLFPNVPAELFVPLAPATDPRRTNRGTHFLRVFARTTGSATLPAVAGEMAAITARLKELYPDTNAKKTPPRVMRLKDEIVGAHSKGLWMLFGAVVLVLVTSGANLASLVLARLSARRRELAVRRALGADRSALLRQLGLENFLATAAGGSLGIGLAWLAIRAFVRWAPVDLPRLKDVGLDPPVLVFGVLATLVAGLFAGLAPVLQVLFGSSGPSIFERMATASRPKSRRRGKGDLDVAALVGRGADAGPGAGRARRILVFLEVALTFLLVATAAVLIQSLSNLEAIRPGFESRNRLTVRLTPPAKQYKTPRDVAAFADRLLIETRELPGVLSAALSTILPMSGLNARADFEILERPPASRADLPGSQSRWVSPRYFETMGIEVQKGREFVQTDTAEAQTVVVIDESLARRYFAKEDPVGVHLKLDLGGPAWVEATIVGVVAGVKHFELEEDLLSTVYLPVAQVKPWQVPFALNLVTKTVDLPERHLEDLRRVVGRVDPLVAASSPRTLDDLMRTFLSPRRLQRTLLVVFAIAALVLAAYGLYAVISYSVTCRTRELGIRAALGASRGRVTRSVLREGLAIVLPGIVLGGIAQAVLAGLLATFIWGVAGAQVPTLMIASTVLVLAALFAMWFPARRAARVAPAVALRAE